MIKCAFVLRDSRQGLQRGKRGPDFFPEDIWSHIFHHPSDEQDSNAIMSTLLGLRFLSNKIVDVEIHLPFAMIHS